MRIGFIFFTILSMIYISCGHWESIPIEDGDPLPEVDFDRLYGKDPYGKEVVTLKIVTDKWSSWSPPGSAHEIDSVIVDVTCGEEFGPTDFTRSSGEKPFKLLRVIDSNTIEVQFIELLVVVGEPISKPSEQNPKIISGERVCFRTRTYDAGTDICLEIID